MVERTLIRPPSSRLGPITDAERRAILAASDLAGKYDRPVDRRSAYEILARRAAEAAREAEAAEAQAEEDPQPMAREYNAARRYSGTRVARSTSRVRRPRESFGSAIAGAVIKELKGATGRRIVRGILGSLFRGR